MKLKIGIDLDDVLNNLVDKWLEKYNQFYNDTITAESIHCWNLRKYVKIGQKIYDLIDEELIQSLTPTSNSIESTERLAKKHDLFVITATAPKFAYSKELWMNEHFPHIPSENLIFCQRKDLIEVDILIDDGTHNLVSFPGVTVKFSKPWNKKYQSADYSLCDWSNAENLLKKIERDVFCL